MADSSGNGHDGTYVNAPTLGASGLVDDSDTSVDFDGGSDHASVAYASWMNVSAITLEAVIQPDTLPGSGSQKFLMQRDLGGSNRVFHWRLQNTGSGAKLHALLWNESNSIFAVEGATTLVAGTKYHVALTYDGTTIRLYLNGVLDGSAAMSGNLGSRSLDLMLASYYEGTLRFDGRIDEVAYYGTALSDTRIAAHYAAATPTGYSAEVLADSPSDYFRLGELSGTTAVNAGTGGHGNGTYAGSPTLGATGLVASDANTCVDLNGSGQYIETAVAAKMYTALTVEAIIRADTFSGNRDIVGRRFNGDALKECWQFRVLDNGKLDFFIVAGGTYYTTYQSTSTLSAGTTYHVAATWDGSNVRLYINGVLDATHAHTAIPNNGSTSLKIGWSAFGSPFEEYWDGKIDEVAVYPTALSGARIDAHYDAATSPGVALDRATETDTANSLTSAHSRSLDSVTETDTANTLTSAHSVALSHAAETDTANAITPAEGTAPQPIVLGKATETDAANNITVPLTVTLDRVTETDTANTFTLVIAATVALGKILETDEARNIFSASGGTLDKVLETDIAQPLTVFETLPTNTSNRIGGRQRTGYGVAAWTPAVVPTPTSETLGGVDLGGQKMSARAFGAVTMNGAQPTFASVSEAIAPKGRQRIIVGGKDVTYFRDAVTPDVTYGLAEPLLFGPGTLHFPQVSGIFEDPGVGDLYWLDVDKEVIVQRVVDDVVVSEDYRGIIIAHWPEGTGLTCELGGEAQGRAALMVKEPPIFRDYLDIGRLAWRAIRSMNLPFEPRLGPVTGIESANFGAETLVTYIDELMARSWAKVDEQWTIMPDETRTYRMTLKDTETVHFTIFTDDSHAVPSLRRDLSAEPNRVYATCITPAGQRVRFGAYPGLQQGKVPAYPMAGGATFNVGTTNADTIDGFGISVMINRLWVVGLLSIGEKAGGYDEEVRQAVISLRKRAGAEPEFGPDLGQMDPATWRILWDLDKTGYSLRGSAIQPAAQADYTRPYRRSGSGAIIGRNRKYDRTRSKVDLHVDMGPGVKRRQAQDWAEAELNLGPNYVGTITIYTGAVLAGDVAIGTTITPEMLMDVRDIRPGMNTRLPTFRGGLFVHVSAVDVAPESVTLTVDTRFRDAPKVWEIMQNAQDTKSDPARKRRGGRASSEVKDSIDPWDEIGGTLDNEVTLNQYWNVVPVVTGQEGTISRFELLVRKITQDGGEISIDPSQFCCAVFGREVTAARLNHLLPFPLTEAGTERWEENSVAAALDALDFLYGAGTKEDPAGYSPGRKSKGASLTGLHTDKAGFAYRSGPEPVVYLAVWVAEETTLKGGRIMWNQLESGA